jgi:hypothetical protein
VDIDDKIRSFAMTNMMLETELESIQTKYEIDLGISNGRSQETREIEQTYFPQFDAALRVEAAQMAESYELFYCLEKTIRLLVARMLEDKEGENWWSTRVIPQHIVGEVKKRIDKENEAGVTPRSTEELDYTTFGELGEIIKTNWALFGSIFNNLKAVEKVFFNLNTLRNPIAHCSQLAEDEKLRLELSLRDWFRLME